MLKNILAFLPRPLVMFTATFEIGLPLQTHWPKYSSKCAHNHSKEILQNLRGVKLNQFLSRIFPFVNKFLSKFLIFELNFGKCAFGLVCLLLHHQQCAKQCICESAAIWGFPSSKLYLQKFWHS